MSFLLNRVTIPRHTACRGPPRRTRRDVATQNRQTYFPGTSWIQSDWTSSRSDDASGCASAYRSKSQSCRPTVLQALLKSLDGSDTVVRARSVAGDRLLPTSKWHLHNWRPGPDDFAFFPEKEHLDVHRLAPAVLVGEL